MAELARSQWLGEPREMEWDSRSCKVLLTKNMKEALAYFLMGCGGKGRFESNRLQSSTVECWESMNSLKYLSMNYKTKANIYSMSTVL